MKSKNAALLTLKVDVIFYLRHNQFKLKKQYINVCVCVCVCVCVYSEGYKIFDPLLIFYVCPLTKKNQSIILILGLF